MDIHIHPVHVRSLERGEEKRARKSLELTTNRRRRGAAADLGSLSSVTGTDKREERGENQISGLLSLSVRLRLGTLAKRRDRTRAQLRKDGIGL